MTEPISPTPEERGHRVPPAKNPPTAVGTMTPPPPRRPFGAGHFRWQLSPWIPFTLGMGAGGVAVVVLTSSLVGHAFGWSLISSAFLISMLVVWVRYIAPPVNMWREHRRLRRRQADLARRSRPAV